MPSVLHEEKKPNAPVSNKLFAIDKNSYISKDYLTTS